ncbi:MAG: hypothetical protein ACP5PA_00980 [Elusimicrobiales bacterium]
MSFFLFFSLSLLSYEKHNYEIEKAEFVSDHAVYRACESSVEISTNAIINILDKSDNVVVKIKTEHAFMNLSSSDITFSSFTIETSSAYISGSHGSYNLDTASGILDNTYSMYDRFIIKGKKAYISKDKFVYNHSYLTTCNMQPPHYRISSSKIILSPKRYFLSYNNILFIGSFPVFYIPFLYKPLGEGTPLISQFYPGYDDRNGLYIKSNYTYRLSRYLKIRGYLDYYSKKGFGSGGEFFGYKPDDFKFNISYYRIDEYGRSPIYWGMNGGGWKNIYSSNLSNLYIQSFLRLPSDPEFNNRYFRSNPFVVSNTRQWDLALTYRTPLYYMRAGSYVIYYSSSSSFFKYNEVLPMLEYQMLTRKISFLPFSHSIYISAQNRRIDRTYFQRHSTLNYSLYNSFKISKNFSSYTSAMLNYITDYSTSSHTSNINIARYSLTTSLRYSYRGVTINTGYSARFRSSINRFSLDKNSMDRGSEEDAIGLDVFWIKDIHQYVNIKTDYDLKHYNVRRSFLQRLNPFSFECYTSYYNYELYFKEIYSINEGHKAFITNMMTNLEKNYLTVGFANYDTNKSRFLISAIFGYNPLPQKGWYGEFGFRYYVDFSKDMAFKFYEKSFAINKEFHDFNTKFALRTRKNSTEFFFYITMKMNDPYRKDVIDNEIDKEFRPWRRFYEERDY